MSRTKNKRPGGNDAQKRSRRQIKRQESFLNRTVINKLKKKQILVNNGHGNTTIEEGNQSEVKHITSQMVRDYRIQSSADRIRAMLPSLKRLRDPSAMAKKCFPDNRLSHISTGRTPWLTGGQNTIDLNEELHLFQEYVKVNLVISYHTSHHVISLLLLLIS